MANRFLDAQLSQARSFPTATTTPVSAAGTQVATLGLNLTGAGPNAQVHFDFTAGFDVDATDPVGVTATVLRDGVPIYQVIENFDDGVNQLLSFSGADYLPPAAFHIYTVVLAFTSADPAAEVDLIGPVSFTAAGYSN
ncbi:hypothetical protein DNH61_21720 [Paenibacillus sambharensis]|uniref:Exosporium leader peptide n=1 Tax=Paenibacillus sambharensis TaxID=1803190 RepID=A0A2W1L003_9BACL|nr:hypothetical protein [Paenibacillus sambharensis]PZD93268.1 hypothetical protein DNH61_21720 [Paenibacillus sambharensis]